MNIYDRSEVTMMETVMNQKLAEMIEQSEVDALTSRMVAIKERAGNPMGVEVESFGSATAFLAKNMPGPSFNTIKGMKDESEEIIHQIINFYRHQDVPIRFELAPGLVTNNLLKNLHEKGFYQHGFHTTLYNDVNHLSVENLEWEENISIRQLKEEEFDTFANIYVESFGLPDFIKEGIADNNKVLHNREGWTFFLARLDRETAGIGVQFVKDGIATLAAAATLPRFRKNGVHAALIKARIALAKSLGCKYVVGQAGFGSVSQQNMERQGLKIAYTKAIWLES